MLLQGTPDKMRRGYLRDVIGLSEPEANHAFRLLEELTEVQKQDFRTAASARSALELELERGRGTARRH